MIVRDGQLVIFIDGTGRFEVPVSEVHGIGPGTGLGEESSWTGREDECIRDREGDLDKNSGEGVCDLGRTGEEGDQWGAPEGGGV